MTAVAVSVLQARGEPASAERLLGEVLIGLDRLGHLRRLVGTQTFSETEAATEDQPAATAEGDPPQDAPAGEDAAEQPPGDADDGADPRCASSRRRQRAPDWALGSASATDHVRLLMEIVLGELRRPDNPRLVEVEPGRWWLRDRARPGRRRGRRSSDRLEWAAYGLLSTACGDGRSHLLRAHRDMFRGHDTPDPELVRAVLESYRDPGRCACRCAPATELTARHAEHGELVGMLVEYGHRLGLRVHVSAQERRRAYLRAHGRGPAERRRAARLCAAHRGGR